jgi:hypothetical protein
VRYGKLRGTESFGMEPISTAGGLEGVHNFDVMA